MFHMTEVSGEQNSSAVSFAVVTLELLSDGLAVLRSLGSVEAVKRAGRTSFELVIVLEEAALGE